ncbi:hypothetical protein AGIG_G25321, partial [Arapaima gigas]
MSASRGAPFEGGERRYISHTLFKDDLEAGIKGRSGHLRESASSRAAPRFRSSNARCSEALEAIPSPAQNNPTREMTAPLQWPHSWMWLRQPGMEAADSSTTCRPVTDSEGQQQHVQQA